MAAFWLVDPDNDWSGLIDGLPLRRAARESVLYLQGAPASALGVVIEGRVRLVTHTSGGQERHIAVIGTHGLIGDAGLWDGGRHRTSAIASTDVLYHEVPQRRLVTAMQADAALLRQVMTFADRRLQVLLLHHALLGNGSALQRVCFALHGLATLYAAPHALGTRITMPFTQEEMASLCSISRVSVSNVLGQLVTRGVLARDGRRLVVRDMHFLAHPLHD